MQNLRDLIRSTSSAYFTADLVDDFIRRVSEWETRARASFFQVKQEGEVATMEYAAEIGTALVDITLRGTRTSTSLTSWSKVQQILLIEASDTTKLYVLGPTNYQFTYTAVLDDNRAKLAQYAHHLLGVHSQARS